MKDKLVLMVADLTHHDEQLMDQHGEGILDGFTRASLDTSIWVMSQDGKCILQGLDLTGYRT